MVKAISSVLLILAVACSGTGQEPEEGFVPDDGFVRSKEVAIEIAVAVWEPIYGAEKIARRSPTVRPWPTAFGPSRDGYRRAA